MGARNNRARKVSKEKTKKKSRRGLTQTSVTVWKHRPEEEKRDVGCTRRCRGTTNVQSWQQQERSKSSGRRMKWEEEEESPSPRKAGNGTENDAQNEGWLAAASCGLKRKTNPMMA